MNLDTKFWFQFLDSPLETKEFWSVTINTDLTEGRGYNRIIAICETEATAHRIAVGRNVQGSPGWVNPITLARTPVGWIGVPAEIEYATKGDKEVQAKADLKAQALRKAAEAGLTPEMLAALKG